MNTPTEQGRKTNNTVLIYSPKIQRVSRNQRRKHPPNKKQTKKSSPRRLQHKNKINNSQDTISPRESSYPTITGHEYSNIAEAQEKDLKTSYMKMTDVLKWEKNASLNETQENTHEELEEINKSKES